MKIEPHLEAMLPQLELRVLHGPQAGSRLTLAIGDYVLGTDDECEVMLAGPRLQGAHARLKFDGDLASITPLEGAVLDAQGKEISGLFTLALGMPIDSRPDDFAAAFLDRGVKVAIVKQGADGVLVVTADERVVVPGIPVDVVCGLGAGDAFGGSFVHGILSGWSPADSVTYANAAGAIVASRLLCSHAMPTDTEVRELLAAAGRKVPA
jgi:sugar/nucleoside kinase (ribokinase family)